MIVTVSLPPLFFLPVFPLYPVIMNEVLERLPKGLIWGKRCHGILKYFLIATSKGSGLEPWIDESTALIDLLCSPEDPAVGWSTKAQKNITQCGFSLTAGAAQTDQLSGLNREIESSEKGFQRAEPSSGPGE